MGRSNAANAALAPPPARGEAGPSGTWSEVGSALPSRAGSATRPAVLTHRHAGQLARDPPRPPSPGQLSAFRRFLRSVKGAGFGPEKGRPLPAPLVGTSARSRARRASPAGPT